MRHERTNANMGAPTQSRIDPSEMILQAARRRLARSGFRGLTLRPVAQECGLTLAAVTYHFSAKSRLIEQLAERERRIDRERHAAFAARFSGLPVLTPVALSAILEAYLDEAAGAASLTTAIWTELLLSAAIDTEARAAIMPWIEERWGFWRGLFAGRRDGADGWAAAAFGYVCDEAIHGLVQRERDDYRLLRAMGLERWAAGFPAVAPGLSQPVFFGAVVARLDPALAMPTPDGGDDVLKDKPGEIARAAAGLIVQEGPDAVTHRAVGERAGAPASTVAYHFNNRMDLVRAGLTAIYLAAQGRLELDGAERGVVVARGTAALALTAARDPGLTAFAVDLRRLRGENLHGRLLEMGGDPARFDLCAAQAASVTLLGATLLGEAMGANGEGAPYHPARVLEWALTVRSSS